MDQDVNPRGDNQAHINAVAYPQLAIFLIVTSWGNGSLGNKRSKRYKILPSLSAVTDSLPTPVGGTKTFEIWDLTNTKMFQ